MEIRVLQYFLAMIKEQSILGAAKYLHISQPTLSRQLADLEGELGKQLFIRGNRRLTLTKEGQILCKRAEEIIELIQKTKNEISLSNKATIEEIYIGTEGTEAIRLIAKTAVHLHKTYPQIRFHISNGDFVTIMEQLDKGLIDFGLVCGPIDILKYNYLPIPAKYTWGVLMRKDSLLAVKSIITPNDLWDKPLIFPSHYQSENDLNLWIQKSLWDLNIVATYSQNDNGSILVEEGAGYALVLNRFINTDKEINLCFRPLSPRLEVDVNLLWKKDLVFTNASECFLDIFRDKSFKEMKTAHE